MQGSVLADRALLVDDDPVIVATLAAALRRAGFLVGTAGSGAEALAAAAGEPPAVVVTDHSLPGMSGAELAQRLREQRPELPVIFLSAYTDAQLVRAAADSGALTYLVKPIDPAALVAAVQAAVHGASARRVAAQAVQRDERAINVVTGLLMERFHLPQAEAYDRLRQSARRERRRLSDLADEILRATDATAARLAAIARDSPARADRKRDDKP